MNYEAIVTIGAICMAFGFMGLVWAQLNDRSPQAGAYLPFFPGLLSIGGVLMILVGFISPLLLNSH
ncbi:hypothetical protein FZW96_18845 [Bacillus sp. BGMRC 2118]|nr:hypothetical protein FZW96_18845 [Bacillus sp. BGMRC 2118]